MIKKTNGLKPAGAVRGGGLNQNKRDRERTEETRNIRGEFCWFPAALRGGIFGIPVNVE